MNRATAAGTAVVAVEPRARWERLYRLVDHVFEHHGDRAGSAHDSGTDLFGLAQSIADRTHGMVSIEDAQSHVLAYSASNDEADELRRLSILGPRGPAGAPGVDRPVRASSTPCGPAVTWSASTSGPNSGCGPAARSASTWPRRGRRRAPAFAGTIWVQQGRGRWPTTPTRCCAARRCWPRGSWRGWRPPRRRMRCGWQELLGLRDTDDRRAPTRHASSASRPTGAPRSSASEATDGAPSRLADVLALSASAFRPDAQVAARGSRVYVLFPHTGKPASVTSWIRGTIGALRTELGLDLRAVIATPQRVWRPPRGARRGRPRARQRRAPPGRRSAR